MIGLVNTGPDQVSEPKGVEYLTQRTSTDTLVGYTYRSEGVKTFCRGGVIPSYYLFSWYPFQRLVPFASRTFRCCLLRGATPGAALVSVFPVR
jgi:hypothetical protein